MPSIFFVDQYSTLALVTGQGGRIQSFEVQIYTYDTKTEEHRDHS